jgi:organic radical activating enzyme
MEKKYIPHAEVPVVEHCNLNCDLCNCHSNLIDKSYYPLEQFIKDIDNLSKHVHFGFMTFMGGEPLLCENLDKYISYARDKKMAEIYRVLSNGLLYKRLSPQLMDTIDVLEISHYPEMKDSEKVISDYLKPLSKKHNFTYYIKSIGYFNEIDTISISEGEAQQGYHNCRRIVDGCCIFNGYYYKCMRPKTTNLYLEKRHGIKLDKDLRITDGVKISAEDFRSRLEAYISDTKMMDSCKYCLMGLEHDVSFVTRMKHLALQRPYLIRTFYKNHILYHSFKKIKGLVQFDEGAHSSDKGLITTSIHTAGKKY